MKNISSAAFLGVLMTIAGICTFGALIAENWGIPWRAWDRSEQAGIIGGGLGVIVGILLILCGCGGNQFQPQPTDPVTVEVTVCEPTLGTAGQYLQLSARCREVALCAVMMLVVQGDRETIRARAENYAEQLDREFDEYYRAGRTGCYNGSVFREATEFLEGARRDGLFCRGP